MASGRKFSIRGRLESQASIKVPKEKRPRTIEEHAKRGLNAFKTTKFTKKIDGHTMFSCDRDMDNKRNPWKFMYDVMLPADVESSFEHREFQELLEGKRLAKEKWLNFRKAMNNKFGEKLTTSKYENSRLGKKQKSVN